MLNGILDLINARFCTWSNHKCYYYISITTPFWQAVSPSNYRSSLSGCPTNFTLIIYTPGTRFSKAPETFRVRKAIVSSPVSKNGEVYTPETSCVKRTSVYIKSLGIKQLCNHKV